MRAKNRSCHRTSVRDKNGVGWGRDSTQLIPKTLRSARLTHSAGAGFAAAACDG